MQKISPVSNKQTTSDTTTTCKQDTDQNMMEGDEVREEGGGQGGSKMDEADIQTRQQQQQDSTASHNDREKKRQSQSDTLRKLLAGDDGGGVAVVCETVVAVHRAQGDEESQEWKEVEYGIPSVVASRRAVVFCIADLKSGKTAYEFVLSPESDYGPVGGDHFHTFLTCGDSESEKSEEEEEEGEEEVCLYGLRFADVSMAKKVLSAIRQFNDFLAEENEVEEGSSTKEEEEEEEGGEGSPLSKRPKVETESRDDEEWVVVKPQEAAAAAAVLVGEGGKEGEEEEKEGGVVGVDVTPEGGNQGVDDVDAFGTLSRKKNSGSRKNSLPDHDDEQKMSISKPSDPKHLLHIGTNTPISKMLRALRGEPIEEDEATVPAPVTSNEKKEESSSNGGSKSEQDQEEAAALPPQPPVRIPTPPPIEGLPVLPPVRKLPPFIKKKKSGPFLGAPPPQKSSHDDLLKELAVFNLKRLRHVQADEAKSATDFPSEDPNDLKSILAASLSRMRSKLQMAVSPSRISTLVSVEEEGEDECDFAIFTNTDI